jgi:ubiquinone/menaquinone biosynthesis C-methylase UbiE
MSSIVKPTPLKFANGFKKLSIYEFQEYQKQCEDKELLKEVIKKLSLQNVLNLMNIGKANIKLFNAFFTPKQNSESLIQLSQIEQDTNDRIEILEPTAGIGNLILPLSKLSNSSHFHIDAVEYISKMCQLGEAIFDDFDNISWYNKNFFEFKTDKKYDYIFINAPFNINYNKKQILDIDFLDYSYQLLKDGGKLCCITSSSVLNNKTKKKYVDFQNKVLNSDNVIIKEFNGFSVDETIIRDMAVNIKMLYIIITKTPDFTLF